MAYAALNSLKLTLDHLVMYHKLEFTFDIAKQFKILSEKISVIPDLLQDLADTCNNNRKMKHLEGWIRDTAQKAEDLIEEFVYIESEALDMATVFEEEFDLHCSMLKLSDEINSFVTVVRKIHEESDAASVKFQSSEKNSVEHSTLWSSNPDEIVVGMDNDLLQVKDRLTGMQPKLVIFTIVGMGGIGKTTLARKEKNEQLAERLYRCLKGQRYLIVMDDVWQVKILNDLKRSFPDDRNGSRIVLTSRLLDVAVQANPGSLPHHMSFLSLDYSWELLSKKVFPKESWPQDLEAIGKDIAQKCHGLPLGILAVAGHLSTINKTIDSWKTVADGIRSLASEDQEKCLDILALSYKSLPHHLKACFLFLGAFPQDFEIPVWRLIRLWVAEGFLRAGCTNSLEEVAELSLQELISRSLVMVRKRKSDGGIKSCSIHDLVRDLIHREVQKEDFLLVLKSGANFFPRDAYDKHHLCFHYQIGASNNLLNLGQDNHSHLKPSILHNRSVLFYDRVQATDFHKMLNSLVTVMDFKLLRVLEILFWFFDHFPVEIMQLVHLRYLALSTKTYFPACLSQLWNLQTVINGHYQDVDLPDDIWKMPQLRHLHLKKGGSLPCPIADEFNGNNTLVLPHLQTLSSVSFTSCNSKVLACVPNLKKLGIIVTQLKSFVSHSCLNHLSYLTKLEKLKCIFLDREQLSDWKCFPPKLRILTLSRSLLPWEKMRNFGLLPNLEVLKLKGYAFQGPEWRVEEDEFCQLKYLQIDGTDLVHWRVTGFHFQRLQQLILRGCRHLAEIPSGVGEIPTLQIIDLDDSSTLAVTSARLLQQEQESMGNDGLIVRIHPRD